MPAETPFDELPYDPFQRSSGSGRGGNGAFSDPAASPYNCKADAINLTGTIANGQTLLTITGGGTLTSADQGKLFAMPGANGPGHAFCGSIVAVTSPTTAVMSVAATATGAVLIYLGTDNTAALQACIDEKGCVLFTGTYGHTGLRLGENVTFFGTGLGTARLWRLGEGAGGPALGMKAGAIAQGVRVEGMLVRCCGVGTALDGINLGTETPGLTDFALGGVIEHVMVADATGWNLRLHTNVAELHHVWVENFLGTSVQNTVGGIYLTGGVVRGYHINVEGAFPSGPMRLAAGGGSEFHSLQFELAGNYPTVDVISIESTQQSLYSVTFPTGNAMVGRDFIRIANGVQHTRVFDYGVGAGMTLATCLNDTYYGWTEAFGANIFNGSYVQDEQVSRVKRVSPASLPAVNSPFSDGLILLDDDGVDGHLIFYTNNRRYRVTGSSF